jgi:hypothetical protein
VSASGVLSGSPTAAGSFSFPVQVTDANKSTASATLSLSVSGAPLSITTVAPLFTGTVGTPYSQTFSAAGGVAPYTWTIQSGATGGLTLDSNGTLHGTPANAGTFSFTVHVADSAGAAASQSYSVTVNPPSLVITAGQPLASGSVGVAYSQKVPLSASGGTAPYTWSMTGSPVPGLTFDPTGLTLSGTPTAPGTFTLTFGVADSAGLTASKGLSLTIAPAGLSISTARTLTGATLNAPFSQTLAASGGAPPYNWSAAGLPAGLTINAATGQISGTPSAGGTFNPVVITVSDSTLSHYSDNFSLTVSLPGLSSISIAGLPSSISPAQQYPLTITLSSPYPAAITGQAIVSFAPDSGVGDSTVLFASGGTSASFNIPAGSLTAQASVPLALQSGTASGAISIALRLQSGGVDITPSPAPSVSGQIDRAAPIILNAQVVRGSNSISIVVTGYSTAREVTQATFSFNAASGQSLQSSASSIIVDTSSLFGGFFSTSSQGSQFLFTQPFTVSGDPTAVVPVSVTLTNRFGSVAANINP